MLGIFFFIFLSLNLFSDDNALRREEWRGGAEIELPDHIRESWAGLLFIS